MSRNKVEVRTSFYRIGKDVDDENWDLEIELIIYPQILSDVIIINMPGNGGDIKGYNDKYSTIAKMLQHQNVGAVVLTGNYVRYNFNNQISLVDDLRAVVNYCIKHSLEICGVINPRIYLMGFSAGASAVAAICSEFEQIDKILLIAPSVDVPEIDVRLGLNNFSGSVYITIGTDDEVVGVESGKYYESSCKKAKLCNLIEIPECDHQFSGINNGKILSKAPLWAFNNNNTFPNSEGGTKLYD